MGKDKSDTGFIGCKESVHSEEEGEKEHGIHWGGEGSKGSNWVKGGLWKNGGWRKKV